MNSFVPEYLSVRLLRVDTFGEPRVEFRHVDSAVRNAVLVLPLIDLNKKSFPLLKLTLIYKTTYFISYFTQCKFDE